MDTTQAQISIKKLNSEIMSLTPSTLIELFEIDISDISLGNGVVLPQAEQFFRFHNNIKLLNTNILWQNQQYIATPIRAEGFETSSKGTLPVPKLSIGVNDGGVAMLALFKSKLRQFGDLAGAKVTRIRTFAKFLDASNFPAGILPTGFETDEFAEFPRDIFFIDRKSNENKNSIEFELASLLDIEGVKLPARLVVCDRCVWNYRGEGCEYSGPPVATENDEDILTILGITQQKNRGLWNAQSAYAKGDYVYITDRNGIKYFFTAKRSGVVSVPTDMNDWIQDACSKSVRGCRPRFARVGAGNLPYGGFKAANKVK